MNDSQIPFIRDYGEWAILDAARRTAGGWRQHLYDAGAMEVPENKHYLAANSAKRNPDAPRGTRFPAWPSKRDRSPTPDSDDEHGDGWIPVLPPGPSTSTDSVGFSDRGTDRNPAPSFSYPTPLSGYPAHPTPGPSQPPFDGLGHFPHTPSSFIPWGPSHQPTPSSGAPSNIQHWETPPPGVYPHFASIHTPDGPKPP